MSKLMMFSIGGLCVRHCGGGVDFTRAGGVPEIATGPLMLGMILVCAVLAIWMASRE
jgi:hypothetical protein